MNTIIETPNKAHNGKTIVGIIILAIGSLLLLDQLNILFVPGWLLSWPMWLIGWGLFIGARHNFRKQSWIIMVGIGLVFLLTENIGGSERFVWPIAIIGAGAWMLIRHNRPANEPYQQNIDK